jgi:hypothetical protein
MDTEPQPGPECGPGSALSSRAAPGWHAWQPGVPWARLAFAAALCLFWSLKRATVNPLTIALRVSYFG